MNRLCCIGNLCHDPESRIVKTRTGEEVTVTTFTVAANNGWGEHRTTEYVRVSAWAGLAETCRKYLKKSSKVYVSGVPSVNAYISSGGAACGNFDMRLDQVEFLDRKASVPYQPAEEEYEDSDEDIEELL